MRRFPSPMIWVALLSLPLNATAVDLEGNDLILTDGTPGIAFDDNSDGIGWTWTIRGRLEYFRIYDEIDNVTFLRFDPTGYSVALGRNASSSLAGMALGESASASATQSLAVGYEASATGGYSGAFGRRADSQGDASIAIGFSASATGTSSIALGSGALAEGENSSALGHAAWAPNANTIILGATPGINGGFAYQNVGLGTSNPVQAVDVERSAAAARFQLTSFTNTGTEAPQYIQRRARGTSAAPTAVQNNDNLGLFSFRGYNGATMGGSRATITAQAAGNFTNSSTPTRLIFATTPVGQTSPQQVMVITPDGKVQVNGSSLNVPDYVFEDDYPLMPLEELRSFIDANGHLPGIPPAREVNAKGLDLAGSQMGLLQKVEELTLYTLEQEQRLAAQDDENRRLREELAALRSGLDEVRRLSGLD